MSEDKYLYAFDASLNQTGLTIFDLNTFEHVLIASFPMSKDKSVTKSEKLRSIEYEVLKLMKLYPMSEMAIESAFISVSGKNQFAVANHFKSNESLFNVQGMLFTRAFPNPIYMYAPKSIKLVVGGHGDSSKEKLQEVIKKKYPHIKFNNLDESDSYSVGITCMVKEHGFEWDRPVVTSEDIKPRKKTTSKSTKQTKPKTK